MTDEKKPTFPIVVELKYPFEINEKTISSVTIKRFPRAILGLPVLPEHVTHGHYLETLCSVTGESRMVFTQMSQRDYREVMLQITPFLL
jgi:hypothetical protein